MYIDIEKVLKLAEVALPEIEIVIKRTRENMYYPFICRWYLFNVENGICTVENFKDPFTLMEDRRNSHEVAQQIAQIIDDFFYNLREAH